MVESAVPFVTDIIGQMNTLKCSGETTMSLTKKADHKLPDYGLVLGLVCIALALVVAKYSRHQPSVEFHSPVVSSADASEHLH